MTSAVVSYYDLSTGALTGESYTGADPDAAAPPGCGHVPGRHDHLAQRVDLATGAVVDWQPPAPAGDGLATWAWDGSISRWVPSPTPLALANEARAQRDRRLAACDWVVLRAMESATPVATAWATYRQALRDLPLQAGFPTTIDWPTEPT